MRKEIDEGVIIYSLGDCIYRVGGGRPYELNDAEDQILQAFLRLPAMSEKTLCRETKNSEARITLLRMLEKYDGAFAQAIKRPPGKSSGGYSAKVIENEG